jgi:chemotaxis protein MotB
MAKKAHGGHHGGAWKVAYADFTTSMMALFIVLWLISSDQEVRESVQSYFKGEQTEGATGKGKSLAPDMKPMSMMPTDRAGRDFLQRQELRRVAEKLRDQFQNSDQSGEDVIRFEFTADGVRIIAIDRARRPFFQAGTADLTQFGRWVLRTIAWELERYPFAVEVEGHAQKGGDQVPMDEKWDLSSLRAVAARSELETGGIKATQFWRVAGYADRMPLDPAKPEDETNRRIAVVIRPKSESGLDELMRDIQR